jgi:REP element-mobilizing transposase RayT
MAELAIPKHRKSIRLSEYDYAHAGAYFVTLCASERRCLFGKVINDQVILSQYGEMVKECWEWLETHFDSVHLDAYVVMPNHIHGVILLSGFQTCRGGSRAAPQTGEPEQAKSHVKPKPLGSLIGAFKTISAKRVNELRNSPGQPLWQRGFYEHVIRREESLNRIREYILTNPLRWTLDQENPDRSAVKSATGA